ncbi:hypothetical protein P7E02_21910 [Enterococcus hulanensis]|uniref:spr1630 family ClpXP-sensitive toxin n=1 Tax=Enterococcus TaxID=1350 RepID=UPI000B5A3098|nr:MULTISPECIES: hypothetical protein [Enterococcus]MBO0409615.1 hypothetical protein [Enterococcus hulanensis]MDT2662555.1 hypothetical protein [Enterococcus hulanensis]OTO21019.1 hypothetical protein A5875_002391 [Enterococcus sp. 3H8_DIV0648]
MKDFELSEAIYQAIVDGTLKGYLQYLEERKTKKAEMRVSGAYAWTKGNHIDDQVSKIGQEQGIDFKIEKAGYTWEYLQFTLSEESENFMLIVKNSRRIKQTFDGDVKKEKNYLVDLSDINLPSLKKSGLSFIQKPEQIELELSDPEEVKAVLEGRSLNIDQKPSRFYIVTYEVNDETKIIDSIELTMPNSETMSLIRIADLTKYIGTSPFEITFEDVAPIRDEKTTDQTIFSGEPNSFGYSVAAEDEEIEE